MGTMESLTLILSNSSVFDLEKVLNTAWGKPKRLLTSMWHVYRSKENSMVNRTGPPLMTVRGHLLDQIMGSVISHYSPSFQEPCSFQLWQSYVIIYIHMRVSGKHDTLYSVPFSVASHCPM